MAVSMAQLQKISQPGMWNWPSGGSRRPTADTGDSWQVRMFADDTGAVGTTWPPRSYSCSFCRREFRSAQALGGHMNVHRRDRAKLRQTTNGPEPSPAAPVLYPSPELADGGGLCLFYPASSQGMVYTQTAGPAAPYNGNTALNLLSGMAGGKGSAKDVGYLDESDGMVADEIDLELRLGW